jgi:hypothetical protein
LIFDSLCVAGSRSFTGIDQDLWARSRFRKQGSIRRNLEGEFTPMTHRFLVTNEFRGRNAADPESYLRFKAGMEIWAATDAPGDEITFTLETRTFITDRKTFTAARPAVSRLSRRSEEGRFVSHNLPAEWEKLSLSIVFVFL